MRTAYFNTNQLLMGFKSKMVIFDIEKKKRLFTLSFEDSIEPDDEVSCI